MISRLSGTVAHIDPKYLVLDVGGVGYKVFTTADTLSQIGSGTKTTAKTGTPLTLWTHLVVRDDALDLYGFTTIAEHNFFELLISVSGIGPKTALGILGVATIHTLTTAIGSGDTSHLTKVSGIGKKNAEKIVLELRDKIDGLDLRGVPGAKTSTDHSAAAQAMRGDADVLEALIALGYRDHESRDVLKKLDKSITDTGARVKAALKLLNK